MPNNAMAHAIAGREYRRRGSTLGGTTSMTAPQRLHLYRRRSKCDTAGSPLTAEGPYCRRSRSPWPTTFNRSPTGRLARPHSGQVAGRAASTDGGHFLHCSTRCAAYTTTWLHFFIGLSEHRRGECSNHSPRHLHPAAPRSRSAFRVARYSVRASLNRAVYVRIKRCFCARFHHAGCVGNPGWVALKPRGNKHSTRRNWVAATEQILRVDERRWRS